MSQANNKYRRLEALLSEVKPADPNPAGQPVSGEVDHLKARIGELEAKLATKPVAGAQSSLNSSGTSIRIEKHGKMTGTQTTGKSWLPPFFSAPVFTGDPEKTQSARLLYQIISVIWILPVLLVTIGTLSGRTEVFPPAIVIALSLVILMTLTRIGWVSLASGLLTAMIVLVFGYADFQNAGNIQPSTLIIAVAIIMSGLLLGRRAPLIIAALVAVSHAMIVYFQMQGMIELSSAPAVGFENIIITTIMILVVAALFQFVISRLQSALDEARKNERELQISNRELQALGISLEQRVADRTHDLELASEVGRTISGKVADLSKTLSDAAETIRSRFELYYTQVYLVDPSGRDLVLRAGTGDAGAQLLRRSHRLIISSTSLNGRAASDRKPVLVEDTQASTNFLPNPLLPLTRSELAVPLIVNEKVVGVLDMQSEKSGTFTEVNLPAFLVLAGQLAIAIQNASLFDQAEEARLEVQEQTRQLTQTGWQNFLNAVERSESMGYAYNQTAVLPLSEAHAPTVENTLSIPIEITGVRVGEVALSDDPGREWTMDEKEIVKATVSRIAQHIENLRLLSQAERFQFEAEQVSRRLTREGWREFLRNREELASGYVYNSNQVLPLNGNGHNETRTGLSYPLVVRDEAIGEFVLEGAGSQQEHEKQIISAVIEQLGDHIENLRLLEQAEQKRLELETVATVSSTASTVLDPDKLLQSVVDLTKERFGLYHAHIYLADQSWSTLLLAAGADEVGRTLVANQHTIPMDAERSLVARAAREGQAVIINDVHNEPGWLPNPLLPETRAEMAVPMIVGDSILGVFDVQSNRAAGFTREDADIYTTLAAQVAVALQNARLYVEQAATVTQLRELDRLKSSFLANMSHELRTPLNSILGFADVMLEELDGPITDTMENDLGLIQKNGQHLLHLINDVLDMAKIEAGRMNLLPEKFKVHEIINEVISITSNLASEKDLSLLVEANSNQEVEIVADRTRLRQVMINLVNNSVKFTEKGTISIRATLDGENVLISVRDTGIGIPPEHLEAVFQEFTQVDTTTTRKAGGTGLGLPISRKLIELHGGRIWAESTGLNGEGATFHVSMPLETKILDQEQVLKN